MWVAFAHFDEAPADAFATVRARPVRRGEAAGRRAERLRERFGLEVAEGYGLTEASPDRHLVGRPAAPVRLGRPGARRDRGAPRRRRRHDVLVGDAGEIWVRGPNVFAGYLDDPEATARVLTDDGWLRTGDIAMCDDDGCLYLVDRAKDLIIVSGFNVFPAEVEEVLRAIPEVAEVGVIGVPHPHTGEAVKAFVVLRRAPTLDEEALIDYALDHLARYKCPSKVIFVDELPRTASGKLLRRQLVRRDDRLRRVPRRRATWPADGAL